MSQVMQRIIDKIMCIVLGRHKVSEQSMIELTKRFRVETQCVTCGHKLLLSNLAEDPRRFRVIAI